MSKERLERELYDIGYTETHENCYHKDNNNVSYMNGSLNHNRLRYGNGTCVGFSTTIENYYLLQSIDCLMEKLEISDE